MGQPHPVSRIIPATRRPRAPPREALGGGKRLVAMPNFAWVVVGDRKRIEAGLGELGMELRVVDADGAPAE